MFRSFMVKNFRCFGDLQLPDLARVNLIAGKNNVGKTSLLEALFLLLGPDNPDLPMRLNALRGLQWFEAVPTETWGWLFLKKETQETIEISGLHENGQRRALRIRLSEPQAAPLPPLGNGRGAAAQAVGSVTTAVGARELVLEYQEGKGESVVSRASLVAEGQELKVKLSRPPISGLPLGIYLTSALHFAQDNADRFSKLQEVGREHELLGPLQVLEPRLQRLVVSAAGLGPPIIQGDIGMGRLVPLPFMGDGMGRLLSYLLAIASAPAGTVLIDEIENGLHYSVLPKVWKAIGDFARGETQVLATTHSWECIRAAHEAFAASGGHDFALHRLDRVGDGIEAVTFTQEMLATADTAGLEVR